jgi:phage tail-like protein
VPDLENPFGAFNFQVTFVGGDGEIKSGFSDVSGLGNEVNYSEYREGTDPDFTVRKVPNTYKLDEVTLKRGLMKSTDIFEWLKAVRNGADDPRTVRIEMTKGDGDQKVTITLKRAQPKKWVGPTLAAKGGGEVALEELHLVHEGIEFE